MQPSDVGWIPQHIPNGLWHPDLVWIRVFFVQIITGSVCSITFVDDQTKDFLNNRPLNLINRQIIKRSVFLSNSPVMYQLVLLSFILAFRFYCKAQWMSAQMVGDIQLSRFFSVAG